MLLAAAVLTWMVFWMRRQAASLRSNLEADVRKASTGGDRALFLLAFLAVGREGFELALFLIATQLATDPVGTVLGAAAGLAAAAGLGWALFASTRKLNLRVFFNVTNVLLILFAAGMVAYGVHEFNEAGLVPPMIEHVWDISPILSETSFIGILLKGLFGYNSNPSLTEVGAYSAYFLLIGIAIWKLNTPAPRRMRAA
jgi:high-affinity iron transporter